MHDPGKFDSEILIFILYKEFWLDFAFILFCFTL